MVTVHHSDGTREVLTSREWRIGQVRQALRFAREALADGDLQSAAVELSIAARNRRALRGLR